MLADRPHSNRVFCGHYFSTDVVPPLLNLIYQSMKQHFAMGFLPWEIPVAFPGESQLRQSRATQPTVHAGCFSVSIIHRTLTWTTGSLMCAQM